MIAAAHGDVPLDHLSGAALFDLARKAPDVQAWLRAERNQHHNGTHGDNDRGIRSFCLTFDDPLPWQAVSNWLMMLRQWRGEGLLMSAWPEEDRRSRIVFITRGIERREVEETWSMLQHRVSSA